jgi:hypothetical protein
MLFLFFLFWIFLTCFLLDGGYSQHDRLVPFKHSNLSYRKKNFFSYNSSVSLTDFVKSDDPIAAQPALNRPNISDSCIITLFINGNTNNYGEILASSFSIPEICSDSSKWRKIILDFSGFVKGLQYDRFGCIWLNDVEILRTTTPEPTKTGITWKIEKDITIYGKYLSELSHQHNSDSGDQPPTLHVSIPNNVSPTYTGTIYFNVSLTIYYQGDHSSSKVDSGIDDDAEAKRYQEPIGTNNLPYVIPLTKTPKNGFFPSLKRSNNENSTYSFFLPKQRSSQFLPKGLLADLYITAHGCDEFYYANLPSANASQYDDHCGGGIYREIQLYLDDGIFAGAVIPFPVIYTGGMNPFLWRPLTGILSFDIPAYRLDLSPFLGYLYDGKTHQITVKVLGNGPSGFWLIDAALLLLEEENTQDIYLISGNYDMSSSYDSEAKVVEESSFLRNEKDEVISILFHTLGNHSYHLEGHLYYSNAQHFRRIVKGKLITINYNQINDLSVKTIQNSSNVLQSMLILPSGHIFMEKSISNYPLVITDYYNEDDTSMCIKDSIDYSYYQSREWYAFPSSALSSRFRAPLFQQIPLTHRPYSYKLVWFNNMSSNATYNTSFPSTVNSHGIVNEVSGSSLQSFEVLSTSGYIPIVFQRKLTSGAETESLISPYVTNSTAPIKEHLRKNSDIFPSFYSSFLLPGSVKSTASQLAVRRRKNLSPSSRSLSLLKEDHKHDRRLFSLFSRTLSAASGNILFDSGETFSSNFSFPFHISFCGYELCGLYSSFPLHRP